LSLAEVRKNLEIERERLEKILGQNSKPLVVEEGLGRGQRIVEQQVRLSNHESTRIKLGEVVEALARLDAGTYGICVDCKSLIGQDRLDAYPHVETCGPCHKKRSKKHSARVW
jgi:DnaK suppressor protein